MSKNRGIFLKGYVDEGLPTESDFKLVEEDIDLKAAGEALKEGETLVRVLYLSVDPYMRGRMKSVPPSYTTSFALNMPLMGNGVVQVVQSKSPNFTAGDLAVTFAPWKDFAVLPAKMLQKLPSGIVASAALSVIGMVGLTAYFGLLHVGQLKNGETVVVSGAAGATGCIVGQIAKIKGCKVIGIAGSDEKLSFLKELGFDKVINYKGKGYAELFKEISEATDGKGVDVYFDNVGGVISDAVYSNLNNFARVATCGVISAYNEGQLPTGPRVEPALVSKRIKMQGFLVGDFASQHEAARGEMLEWFKEGKLKDKATIKEGLENTPKAFIGLLQGENIGKMVVKVADPQ